MRTVSALAALGVLALAGCGGGSNTTSTNEVSTIKEPRTEPTSSPPSTVTTTKPSSSSPQPSSPSVRALNPPATPTGTVKFALTSADPASCELYTRAAVEKSFGGVAGCRSSIRSGGRADSVEIVNSSVQKKKAFVVAVPHGGPSSAQKLQITLVKSGKRWLLASIKSNVPVGP